jgi:SAM-dependent methyltransferase
MADERHAEAVPNDYDEDPRRFRLARSVLVRFGAPDIHALVARRLREERLLPVLDVGCGEGELARHLPGVGWTGVDRSAELLRRAPAGAVRGDATALPFADESSVGCAAVRALPPRRAGARAGRGAPGAAAGRADRRRRPEPARLA